MIRFSLTLHDDLRAAARDAHVREHAGLQETAASLLERARAGAGDVGADRLGVDALVALNDNLLRESRLHAA